MAIQQVRAKINGAWHVLTYNSVSGKYEKTITAPTITSFNQPEGYYPIEIEATDDFGNKTMDTGTGRLTVRETVKPIITITSPTSGAMLGTNTPQITFTLRDEVNGSGVKLSTLTLKINSGAMLNSSSPGMVCTTVTNGYDCTYTPQTALSDGSHTIVVNVSDNDGNTAAQKSTSFIVDTIPPVLDVAAPLNGLKTNLALCNVMGTTNDTTSSSVTVKITLNNVDQGEVTVGAGGIFSKAMTLQSGTNTVVVRSTDLTGQFTEITRTVYLNTIAPVISNIGITPNPAETGTSITISCKVT